jgi:hypothetical protein
MPAFHVQRLRAGTSRRILWLVRKVFWEVGMGVLGVRTYGSVDQVSLSPMREYLFKISG